MKGWERILSLHIASLCSAFTSWDNIHSISSLCDYAPQGGVNGVSATRPEWTTGAGRGWRATRDGGVRDKGTAEPPSLALHPRASSLVPSVHHSRRSFFTRGTRGRSPSRGRRVRVKHRVTERVKRARMIRKQTTLEVNHRLWTKS